MHQFYVPQTVRTLKVTVVAAAVAEDVALVYEYVETYPGF